MNREEGQAGGEGEGEERPLTAEEVEVHTKGMTEAQKRLFKIRLKMNQGRKDNKAEVRRGGPFVACCILCASACICVCVHIISHIRSTHTNHPHTQAEREYKRFSDPRYAKREYTEERGRATEGGGGGKGGSGGVCEGAGNGSVAVYY